MFGSCQFSSKFVGVFLVLLIFQNSVSKTTYKITFFTSKKTLGGTDATIFMKLYGKKGFWTKTYEFEDYDKKKFEAGSQDSFTVNGPNVGTVTKINVWHDNKGVASGWKLEKINVIRHLTPTEICDTLEQMKKKSELPKAIKMENGELFINNEAFQDDKSDIKKQKSSSSSNKNGQKHVNESDLSSSSSSIDKFNSKSHKKFRQNKTVDKDISQILTLPFAEETTFTCDKWLSKDVEKDSLNRTFASEVNCYLFSTINLLINPDN